METDARYVYILGVDPGTTTGLAIARFNLTDDGRPEAVWSGELDWHNACEQIERRLEQFHINLDLNQAEKCIAVCEQYIINAQTAQRGQQGANDALGMIGVVRRNCQLAGIEFADPQQASAAKNLIRDSILKRLHFYAPAQPHVNDAYRHATLYAVKRIMSTKYLVGE